MLPCLHYFLIVRLQEHCKVNLLSCPQKPLTASNHLIYVNAPRAVRIQDFKEF